ncbi:Carbohydrate-selective porin OprB [Thalassoporum mexicanum PCC 7367]|uniref:iron uptake porin n=1 Tax=Thalassoporum mexicanum TaxID=3457544 RepID=UPI00029FD99F|nr:iron uptake porin [Pseudanabaena sp. PCC 7367]AFY71680.1 Carbohydrate-selective porin OprB [Pseudanabaena sp. PCC 7367]
MKNVWVKCCLRFPFSIAICLGLASADIWTGSLRAEEIDLATIDNLAQLDALDAKDVAESESIATADQIVAPQTEVNQLQSSNSQVQATQTYDNQTPLASQTSNDLADLAVHPRDLSDLGHLNPHSEIESLDLLLEYGNEVPTKPIAAGVTSVSQLSDVQPTDWAFTALQSLVERYGCIAGYDVPGTSPSPIVPRLKQVDGSDRVYRGQQAITRYEFAAGLNACLDKINDIISSGLADKVSQEDLAALQRLQEEFAAELAALRGRVDVLEATTARLEAQQFSTVTKLNGLAWMNLTGAFGGDIRREIARRDPVTNQPLSEIVTDNPNATLSGLVWLNLVSSFTGKDQLVSTIVMGNGNSPANVFASAGHTNTWGAPFTDQTAGPGPFGENVVALQEMFYEFPIFNERARLKIGPQIVWYRVFDISPNTLIFTSGGTFSSIDNTLTNNIEHGAGAVIQAPLGDKFEIKVGYLSESNTFLPQPRSAGNPDEGLFGGTYSLTTELGFRPTDSFALRLLYNRTNQNAFTNPVDGFFNVVGDAVGEPIRGLADDGFGGALVNAQSNVFTLGFDWRIAEHLALFGRYGTGRTSLNPANPTIDNGVITMQSFQVGLAFPDLFKRGAQGMISFAMPYDVKSGSEFLVSGSGDGGTQYDLELVYFYPINRNIAIVPNLYFIFNPNNFSSNPTVTVANLRLSFRF